MMKYTKILSAAVIGLLAVSCIDGPAIEFSLETDKFELGPEGGVRTLRINSDDNWIVMTDEPWITVSPANGRGTVDCSISVDTTLYHEDRKGIVRVSNLATGEEEEFDVLQGGYDYSIALDDDVVSIDDYAEFDSRSFDVIVSANVDFKVSIPDSVAVWLTCTKDSLALDRGMRPRNVRLHFDWKVNSRPYERIGKIELHPKSQVTMGRQDMLTIIQDSAIPIPENSVAGDSLALLAINRALGCWSGYDTSEQMKHWEGVSVWTSGDNKGRVRSAEFFLFQSKEGLPYEVRYLTAAEELYFYSNVNSFLYNLDVGEDICELTNLRRLTVGAYGLTTLPDSFTKLTNLEYLDLASNNFQKIPEILTPENFPNLHSLLLTSNQRNAIYDLSNTNKANYGGLVDECPVDINGNRKFPVHLLKWSQLDTLRLSVNYLQGTLPTDQELIDEGFPVWTEDEVMACDTLKSAAAYLVGRPKVLPDTEFFAINLNRLHGDIPDWLLYHPNLDWWYPLSLVFPQEGKTIEGVSAGFNDEPTNMNYYYQVYTDKYYSESYDSGE